MFAAVPAEPSNWRCSKTLCVFKVNLKSGTNILYWRTGGILGSKVVKPILLKNIQIEGHWHVLFLLSFPVYFCGKIKVILKSWFSIYRFFFPTCPLGVAYTSECFPCKPGTFSRVPGSSTCESCPRDTYSGHGASSCTACNTTTQYAGMFSLLL